MGQFFVDAAGRQPQGLGDPPRAERRLSGQQAEDHPRRLVVCKLPDGPVLV